MTDTPPVSETASPRAEPWWARLIPDTRAIIAIGFFALTGYVIFTLARTPTLGESKLFFALAEAIVITGLIGGVVAFYYSASKNRGDGQ